MKKALFIMAMTAFVATAFAQKKLVLYFSETQTTQKVALALQKQLSLPDKAVEAIELVQPYTGNMQETMQRAQREKEPALKPLKAKIADYDIIFLGYPIWSGTYALPIASLLKQEDSLLPKPLYKLCPNMTMSIMGIQHTFLMVKKHQGEFWPIHWMQCGF